MPTTLTYDALKAAVTGGAAALRLTLKLEAVSPKVFPPTYEGGKYATEDRVIDKVKVPCVLLDSVPSQANRMEFALQEACDGGEIKLPVTTTDFGKAAEADPRLRRIRISSLQAPHRISDAILRDASLFEDGKKPVKFKDTVIGKALDDEVDAGNATALFKYAPHCLVFGLWHSTGDKRRAMGVKFARVLISEIIGVNAVAGVVTASRIDPLGIRANSGVLYKSEGGWTLDEANAMKKGKEAIKLGTTEKKKGDGSPAKANHGNIPPQIVFAKERDENGKLVSKGGFTIDYAEQITVLSLPGLRRLRFPATLGAKSTPEGDAAARTYLAALGLLGVTLAVESGYDLRSRCVLHAKDAVTWQLLGRPGVADETYSLDKQAALKLYADALAAVEKRLHLDEVILTPSADLVTLLRNSMDQAAVTGEDE